jgi:ABC-type branched-subunit amino acid transport system substrate-binding protein
LLLPDAGPTLEAELRYLAAAGVFPKTGERPSRKDRRLSRRLFLCMPAAAEPATLAGSARYLEGALVAADFAAEPGTPAERFAGSFRTDFGRDPSDLEAWAHDALLVAAEASSSSPGAALQALRTSGFNGVTGAISFSSGGDSVNPPDVITIQAGRPSR